MSREEKQRLIQHFTTTDVNVRFQGVGESAIKGLCLCRNNNGEFVCLKKMLGRKYDVPDWLNAFQIHAEDYFPELDKYLMPEKDIYKEIVFEQWDDIKPQENVEHFYEKVKYLYELDADSNKTLEKKDYLLGENGEYMSRGDIFYNDSLLNTSLKYTNLQNAIYSTFALTLPGNSILSYLEVAPFKTSHNSLTSCGVDSSAETITKEDVLSLIQVCNLHNEAFFTSFIIKDVEGGYYILEKSDNCFQVYTTNRATREFIKDNCSGTMYLLPTAFSEYKNSEGVISGEVLHGQILSCVENVDEHKDLLVDIVTGDARATLLDMLSSVTINLDNEAGKDGFEYKVLAIASKVLRDDDERRNFYEKMVFVKDGKELTYADFPETVADSFSIEGCKQPFLLSEILPNENQNTAILNEVVDIFSKLGIEREKLISLLGITQEVDVDAVFQSVRDKYHILKNTQQLAFVMQMGRNDSQVYESFQLVASNKEVYECSSQFYSVSQPFLEESCILDGSYDGLDDYIDIPETGTIVRAPYISEETFCGKGIKTKDDEGRICQLKVSSLLDFLQELYKSKEKLFEGVGWDCLKEELGFDPTKCVYPNSFALDCEKLPSQVEKWCEQSEQNRSTIAAMGVLPEDSVIIRLRKALLHVGSDSFDEGKVSGCDCTEFLENTLEWYNQTGQFPLNENDYRLVQTIIERINKLRGSSSSIVVLDEFNIELLRSNSTQYDEIGYEEWQEETGLSIYLYDGALPKSVTIGEYMEATIYEYQDGDICDDGNCSIFVNNTKNLQDILLRHATQNGVGLSTEMVYQLFHRNIEELQKEKEDLQKEKEDLQKKYEESQQEIKRLKGSNLQNNWEDFVIECKSSEKSLARIHVSDTPYAGLSQSRMHDVLVEAKDIVRMHLEKEGYEFTQGICEGSYGNIYGVKKDGVEYPLVVHSYMNNTRSFQLTAFDWQQLARPNSMLWVRTCDGLKCIPFYALAKDRGTINISFDASNFDVEDRSIALAQVLRYYKGLHFDFGSLLPSCSANAVLFNSPKTPITEALGAKPEELLL